MDLSASMVAPGDHHQDGPSPTRMRSLLGDRSGRVAALVGCSVVAGFAEAGVLALIAQVAASMVAGADRLHVSLGPQDVDLPLGTALSIAWGLAILRLLLQIAIAWLPARISAEVQARLRDDLFRSFSRASWSVQSGERDGHFQEIMTSQVAQATLGILNVANLLSGAAMFSTLAASAFLLSVPVALLVLVSAVGLFALLRPLNRLGQGAARSLSQANMDHAAGISETARLAEESQVFGTAERDDERIGALTARVSAAFFRFQLSARLSQSVFQSLAIVLIVGGLAGLYAAGVDDLPSLGAAVLMLVRAGTYGQQLQSAHHRIKQSRPYLDRIDAAMHRYESSAPASGERALGEIGRLRFEDVHFAYRPDAPVLRGVSFEIEAGETIGVVGPSGAGKSTLVQILLRLREPDGGRFTVDGWPAATFARGDWQRRVAYLSQEPRVIHGTVAENIRYHRDASIEAVERAARLAHIEPDILAMPDGYDTIIGQREAAVSGGQRQRICLARSLLLEPDLLVLDEPTSALDLASEAAIQSSLESVRGQLTLLIVAHRISTLSICDRVLVLDGGRAVAFAPAAELAETNDFFRRATALSEGSS